MKEIEKLNALIEEEIEGARCYARLGAEYKESRPEFSRKYVSIANQELEHMNMLHGMVVTLIDEYRVKEGEPPADMLAVYNYLHKKNVDKVTELKAYISNI